MVRNRRTHAAVRRAIELLDGPSRAAERLGVSRQTVHNWLNSGRIPADNGQVIEVEMAVDGAVTRYELRPDVYVQ